MYAWDQSRLLPVLTDCRTSGRCLLSLGSGASPITIAEHQELASKHAFAVIGTLMPLIQQPSTDLICLSSPRAGRAQLQDSGASGSLGWSRRKSHSRGTNLYKAFLGYGLFELSFAILQLGSRGI